MGQLRKNQPVKVTNPLPLVWAVLLNLLLVTATFAQSVRVPDCCVQAMEYKQRYEETRGLLAETRKEGKTLIDEKDNRIKKLEADANDALRAERGARLNDQRRVLYLIDALKTEALTKRFLGFGRKRAIRKILKQADAL